jgi:hypothetical protein
MLACWLLECLLLIAIIVLPERFASLEIPLPPAHPQWDVIYYSGDELPQTQDRGGAEAGKSGRAGGQQAHHRTQTIRVARGDKPDREGCGRSQTESAALRFRRRQSARLQTESRTASRRRPAFRSRRAHSACDERVPPSPELNPP